MSLLSPVLEAFLSIAKHKTVHAAAKELHLTQTAVTQRIRALEGKLKTTLFTRTRRGMMLTHEGEALLRYCHAAKALENETLSAMYGTDDENHVECCITAPTSIMRSRVIPRCFSIIKTYPQLLLQFHVNDQENRVRALRSGEAQLAIILTEHVTAEMKQKELAPEQYVLVAPSTWKKRKLRDIIQSERIIDFEPADPMTFNYLKQFELFQFARHERYFANRTDLLCMMVRNGIGYGVLTREFAKPYIQSGELMMLNSGQCYDHYMSLAWYERHEPPAYFKALIEAIQ